MTTNEDNTTQIDNEVAQEALQHKESEAIPLGPETQAIIILGLN